jgi:hypothetical protein
MDEFRMKALDAKLSRIRGVYYNMQNATAGVGGPLLGDLAPRPRPKLQQKIDAFARGETGAAAGEPHVSITDLKRWQDSVPVVIASNSVVAGTLPDLLKRALVPVSVVPPSGLPDITIGRGLAIMVLTLSQVARASLDSTIFTVLEGLKLSYDKAILVAWDDGLEFGDDVTKDMVVDWLERFADLAGVKVVSTSSAGLLARVVTDFHNNVCDKSRLAYKLNKKAIEAT